SSDKGFNNRRVLNKNDTVAEYNVPWAKTVKVVAKEPINTLIWQGMPVKVKIITKEIKAPAQNGAQVGSIQVISNNKTVSTDAVLDGSITTPSWTWRIFR
ncbi:MAG TPA: hypothetical protein VFB03_02310, partial [Candidatus Saccharimonadales bacterium]|nr:hypothetical protein [Candidatus Saccharimonadales bacterium]